MQKCPDNSRFAADIVRRGTVAFCQRIRMIRAEATTPWRHNPYDARLGLDLTGGRGGWTYRELMPVCAAVKPSAAGAGISYPTFIFGMGRLKKISHGLLPGPSCRGPACSTIMLSMPAIQAVNDFNSAFSTDAHPKLQLDWRDSGPAAGPAAAQGGLRRPLHSLCVMP